MFCKSLLRHRSFIFLLFLAASQFSCTKRAPSSNQRLAVLAFDNLTSDAQLDWMSRAAAAALVDQLTGVKGLYVIQADSLQSAYTMRATRFVQGYFFASGGRLEAHGAIEDAQSHKSVAVLSASGPVEAGILPLIDRIAHQLSADAKPYSTANPAAFHAFANGLTAPNAEARNQAFETATHADPNYSAAYVFWAEALLQSADRDGVERVTALGQRAQPNATDQAKLEFLAATARGDAASQIRALATLSALSPLDPQLFRRLAELELAQRRFSDAAHDYENAARVDPEDAATLNSLGYARAFSDDLEGARRSLAEYQKRLPPEDPNGLDSLGEVNFFFGDFRAAEASFLAAQQKNPAGFGAAELLKAAQARLMTGDLPAADAIFRRFEDLRRQSGTPLGDFQFAQWRFLTGRRKDAMSSLRKLIPALATDAAAGALCQLSIWKLQTGDSKAALDDAEQAASKAVNPPTRSMIALARFIITHPGASSGSKLADALALLFQRDFERAAPLLDAAYHGASATTDGQIRTLLAWADIEIGNLKDAEPLLRLYPIPLASGDTIFASLIFPRVFYLKGVLLANQGKREEAKRQFQLYLRFAGDVPDIFGDEEKARKALQ